MGTIHILLVDDDRDDYELFVMALEALNTSFDVTWKENGLEALTYLKHEMNPPDLIVMDLNMPLKDGFQTLVEIKKSEQLSHIPVHIFTTSTDHVDKCKTLGCTGYFRKPMRLAEYKSSIQNMLAEEYFPSNRIFR